MDAAVRGNSRKKMARPESRLDTLAGANFPGDCGSVRARTASAEARETLGAVYATETGFVGKTAWLAAMCTGSISGCVESSAAGRGIGVGSSTSGALVIAAGTNVPDESRSTGAAAVGVDGVSVS
jgi:hypothetical protein